MKGGEGDKGQRIADSEIFHSSLGFLRDHLSHVALDARAEPFPSANGRCSSLKRTIEYGCGLPLPT